jgi:hypothetical protein
MERQKQRALVMDRLEEVTRDIQELKGFVEGKKTFTREEKEKARGMMKRLKETLKGQGQPEMGHYAEDYLVPALRGALGRILGRWNSDPIRSWWAADLFEAELEVDYYLTVLKAHDEASLVAISEEA